MTILVWAFDAILSLMLVWLAWQCLVTPQLFTAVSLFISFSLLVALAWARLSAPDIALAEVAIGAGLTGALLLGAARWLENSVEPNSRREEDHEERRSAAAGDGGHTGRSDLGGDARQPGGVERVDAAEATSRPDGSLSG